tara:strand:- start:344 stop:547 length:204 start_codon:yes stop_codon:yes gene_type:complete
MTLNNKYCKLLDLDFGYDNQALANKIEKTSDDFAINFYEWRANSIIKGIDQYTNKECIEIYKKRKNL